MAFAEATGWIIDLTNRKMWTSRYSASLTLCADGSFSIQTLIPIGPNAQNLGTDRTVTIAGDAVMALGQYLARTRFD